MPVSHSQKGPTGGGTQQPNELERERSYKCVCVCGGKREYKEESDKEGKKKAGGGRQHIVSCQPDKSSAREC